MKNVLTLIAVIAFSTTMAMALDGDTYRNEREQVEGLANSSYIQSAQNTNAQTVDAASSSEKKVVRKRSFNTQNPTTYYHFGAIGGFKGSNGH